ncbi:MAG: AAA-associated domain-containing protein [Anaerolineae bacterium]|nr:AAA-associated domain-containing protein [Anaerolineae bacterium]
MEQNEVLVKLDDISQAYGRGSRRFMAIQDINLAIRESEFVALLGPSGCGKSTLLRIVVGLQKPTTGQVIYRGKPLQGVNPQAAIVFQTFALFPWLTVLQNVEVALEARGLPDKMRTPRAVDLLDRVGLDGFETAYPRELSGGMRQKVGFARAMAVEPELLCLDEPFSALDMLSAESLRGELLELWTGGNIPTKAILMVTHNIEEAIFMADRVVVMDKAPGRVVADLPIELPYPRNRKSPPFTAMVDHVYGILAGHTEPEHVELGTAPGEPGHTRALPHASINELMAILEWLEESPGDQFDIYIVAEELRLDSDSLLRLTDAAELLGFATVAQGDITITPLGEAFAEASILGRKDILATRLRRLPLFRWLMTLLRAAGSQQLNAKVVETALELEFAPEEVARQMETLINWGRYAELIAYDDEVFYVEPDSATKVA